MNAYEKNVDLEIADIQADHDTSALRHELYVLRAADWDLDLFCGRHAGFALHREGAPAHVSEAGLSHPAHPADLGREYEC